MKTRIGFWSRTLLGIALAVAIAALFTLPASAGPEFPPKALQNVQVLPKDMPIRDVIDVMKKFSQSLGVRCHFCHVGEEGMNLSEFDFASDDNPHKEAARVMMRMTGKINETWMSQLGEHGHGDKEAPRVTCFTCHRGKAKPE